MKKNPTPKARTTRRTSPVQIDPLNDAARSAFRGIDAGFQFSILLMLARLARVDVRILLATGEQRGEHARFKADALQRKRASRKFDTLKAQRENIQRQIRILIAGFELRKAQGKAEKLTHQEHRRRERLYGRLNDIDTQMTRLYEEA